MADSISYQEAKTLIQNNPEEANRSMAAWQQDLKAHPENSSINSSIETMQMAYEDLRFEHEDSQMQNEGSIDRSKIPNNLAATSFLAASFLQKPKIMEHDGDYQKIEENLKKEWLKNNPGKDFLSKEGIDYLYGSLDDKTQTSLNKEAETTFRANPKFAKKLEKYDQEKEKIYKNYRDDLGVSFYRGRTQAEVSARLELFKTKPKNSSFIKLTEKEKDAYRNQIAERVHKKYLREFAEKNPGKTKIYHDQIKAERVKPGLIAGFMSSIGYQSPQSSASNVSTPVPNQRSQTPPPSHNSGNTPSKLLNNLTNLPGINNPLKFMGPRVAARRGFLAFLLGPAGLALLTIIFMSIITFAIVISGIAPNGVGGQTTNSTQ